MNERTLLALGLLHSYLREAAAARRRRAGLATLPSGPRCELAGSVAWVRDALGEDAPPGFGVRFADLSREALQLLQAYSEAREPMLHDE